MSKAETTVSTCIHGKLFYFYLTNLTKGGKQVMARFFRVTMDLTKGLFLLTITKCYDHSGDVGSQGACQPARLSI